MTTKSQMIKVDTALWTSDSMRAWEEVNEAFLKGEGPFHFRFDSKALYVYDVILGITNPQVDPNFDFGRHFNYTINKWKTLVSNYLDKDELESVKEEVKSCGKKVYNIAMQFTNKHGHGKNCLLSMIFSKRFSEEKPTVTVFLRASEVTKRLIVDLLFFQRMGEYVYDGQPFKLVIHFNQLFQDDAVLLMYHAHKDLRKFFKDKSGVRKEKLLAQLNKMLETNPEDIKYKVHRRAAKVLHPELYKYPKTLAKDCQLF